MLDLGSGGGINVLLAAAKVGQEGCAIGLDVSAVRAFAFLFAVAYINTFVGNDLPCQKQCSKAVP